MSSSQQAMPPPRSLAHEYQPLRGVMTTSGGCSGRLLLIVETTLNAVAVVRVADAISVTSVPRCARSFSAADSSLVTCSTGGPYGLRNESALFGQSPGRPPRVTHTIAR
jgi:hypothetical protein